MSGVDSPAPPTRYKNPPNTKSCAWGNNSKNVKVFENPFVFLYYYDDADAMAARGGIVGRYEQRRLLKQIAGVVERDFPRGGKWWDDAGL